MYPWKCCGFSHFVIRFDCKNSFLFVDIQSVTVQKSVFGVIDRVIHHRDVRAGFDMSVEKFAVISFVNHITRSYDNVFMRHLLEALYVFHISGNVGTVNVADLTVFCIHDIQTAAF